MDEDEARAVVIVEGGNAVDAALSVEKASVGKIVFQCNTVAFENRAAVESGSRTDDPCAGAIVAVFGMCGEDREFFGVRFSGRRDDFPTAGAVFAVRVRVRRNELQLGRNFGIKAKRTRS